jgi:uncharacterized caspase-like protein
MIDEIPAFISLLKQGDVALLYYSGHGVMLGGKNYLLATDFKIPKRTAEPTPTPSRIAYHIRMQGVSLESVFGMLKTVSTSVNIFIFDACRDDPLEAADEKGIDGFGAGFSAITGPQGTYIAFASAPNEPAADGPDMNHNSLFTEKIIETLAREPTLEIDYLFRKVRRAVWEANAVQHPWSNNNMYLDFRFFDRSVARADEVAAEKKQMLVQMGGGK